MTACSELASGWSSRWAALMSARISQLAGWSDAAILRRINSYSPDEPTTFPQAVLAEAARRGLS